MIHIENIRSGTKGIAIARGGSISGMRALRMGRARYFGSTVLLSGESIDSKRSISNSPYLEILAIESSVQDRRGHCNSLNQFYRSNRSHQSYDQ